MPKNILQICNLTINVGDKTILRNVSLNIPQGNLVCCLGNNGAGKSSLIAFLAGKEDYRHSEGKVFLKGEDLTAYSIEERAQKGLFIAFQNPIFLPGVNGMIFLKTIYYAHCRVQSKKIPPPGKLLRLIKNYSEQVGIDYNLLKRDMDGGLSGGERKRIEWLQALLLQPDLIILDELDSGMDWRGIELLLNWIQAARGKEQSFLLVTHSPFLEEKINPDCSYIMKQGRLFQKERCKVH